MKYLNELKTPIILSFMMLVICGFIYPFATTFIAQGIFKEQAGGSLIEINGKVIGARYIGQNYTKNIYLQSRPSAINYNIYSQKELDDKTYKGVRTGSDNYASSNPKLKLRVESDLKLFMEKNHKVTIDKIPSDLLTSSGSGLDPHISLESATIQLPEIAINSGISEEILYEFIKKHTATKLFGIFGEETVNVLLVNIEIAGYLKLLD